LVLVPSYWIAPLVVFEQLGEGKELFLFGARPTDVSLVPGDLVPDGMLRTIKTLGDPTRLRILRYLSRESITPAELARRLRLRAPTVTHHLNLLRLAGLVYLTLGESGKRRYEARPGAVDEAFAILRSFLTEDEN
jgi:DNA-binding transcriptional ArsR family regulator